MAEKVLKSFTVKYWKQNGPKDAGHFEEKKDAGHFEEKVMKDIPGDTSFLEMLDILNEQLIEEGKEPFVFDHDCREGICGMCSLYINGTPHGKTERGATTCQLYMRKFNEGDTITIEPWRLGVRQVSLSSRTAWLTVQPSTRSSRQVATPLSAQVLHRMPMPSSFLRRMLMRQWIALPASVVVPA